MPVEVRWYQDHPAVLALQVRGAWTWDDMHAAHDQLEALLEERPYPVYLLYDFSEAGPLPRDALTGIRSLNRDPHPHSAETYLVGLNRFYRVMIETFSKVYGNFANAHAVIPCATLEDALRLIAQRR